MDISPDRAGDGQQQAGECVQGGQLQAIRFCHNFSLLPKRFLPRHCSLGIFYRISAIVKPLNFKALPMKSHILFSARKKGKNGIWDFLKNHNFFSRFAQMPTMF